TSDRSEGSFPPRPVYHVDHEMDLTPSGSVDSQQVIPAAPVEPSGLPSLKEMEREAIERALVQVGQNRRKAAQLLGIGVRTLYRKLDEYGLK
ncbi:MAG: hypothetical protein HOE86_00580, partial [Gemmatimonadetes bacterium]|nr:hypothetical protein [Gemmatimonadota bacterium]